MFHYHVNHSESKAPDLELGLTKHAAHGAELKDPRHWNLYSSVFGDELNVISKLKGVFH